MSIDSFIIFIKLIYQVLLHMLINNLNQPIFHYLLYLHNFQSSATIKIFNFLKTLKVIGLNSFSNKRYKFVLFEYYSKENILKNL